VAPAGRADRSTRFRRSNHRLIAEGTWSARCIGALRRIKHVRATTRRWRHRRISLAGRRRLRRWRRAASRSHLLKTIFGIVLHALELQLQLLIAVLKLFDRSGELTQRTFHPVEPD